MAFPIIAAISALAQFVPAITRWLSGDNPGPVAEGIATVARTVTGQTTIEGAIAAIQSEPDKQRAFQLAIADRADDLEKAYLLDRQSARARDVEIVRVMGRNRRADNLAYGAIFMLSLCIIGSFFVNVPAQTRDILLMLVGALIVIVKDVYGFEFGTSKNAERNAQSLSDYLKNGNGKVSV